MIVLGCIEIHKKKLYKKDYCKVVECFINFAFSNLKNNSGGEIRCSCVKFKNKNFHQSDIVMIQILKKYFIEK
jgi:hypothetical protein